MSVVEALCNSRKLSRHALCTLQDERAHFTLLDHTQKFTSSNVTGDGENRETLRVACNFRGVSTKGYGNVGRTAGEPWHKLQLRQQQPTERIPRRRPIRALRFK